MATAFPLTAGTRSRGTLALARSRTARSRRDSVPAVWTPPRQFTLRRTLCPALRVKMPPTVTAGTHHPLVGERGYAAVTACGIVLTTRM
jgi:hypothetical protein